MLGLSHWCRVTHTCVGKLTIIGSDNGLSPGRRQAITWTSDGIYLTGPLETNFNEILIEIDIFSFTKMHLEKSSGKWRPFCLGLNVLPLSCLVYQVLHREMKVSLGLTRHKTKCNKRMSSSMYPAISIVVRVLRCYVLPITTTNEVIGRMGLNNAQTHNWDAWHNSFEHLSDRHKILYAVRNGNWYSFWSFFCSPFIQTAYRTGDEQVVFLGIQMQFKIEDLKSRCIVMMIMKRSNFQEFLTDYEESYKTSKGQSVLLFAVPASILYLFHPIIPPFKY